jgi:hypothetical protein
LIVEHGTSNKIYKPRKNYLFIYPLNDKHQDYDVFTDSGAARFFFISLYFELFPISGACVV